MALEIERKYKLDRFPDALPELFRADVEQGYLSTRPTVRIRSVRTAEQTTYELCFKGEGDLAREEIELPLTAELFAQLRGLVNGPLIRKDFRVYALPDGKRLECSLVDAGEPTSFWYAEVEFASIEEANTFIPPDCVGEDITGLPGVSMGSYWRRTRGTK